MYAIQMMLDLLLMHEVVKREHGRWQWRGFWLDPWENKACLLDIIRAYVCGSAWHD